MTLLAIVDNRATFSHRICDIPRSNDIASRPDSIITEVGLNTLTITRLAQVACRTNAQLGGWRIALAFGREQCAMSKAPPKGALAGRDGWCSTPGSAPTAAEGIMSAVHHSQAILALNGPPPYTPRRRRVYVARWRLALGGALSGGVIVGRRAAASGRQVYVVVWPCGTARHLCPQK